MKKQWMVVAIVAITVSAGARRAAAQGPAGVGATTAAESSSHATHSYNPIKWMKKDPKSGDDSRDASSERNKKLTARPASLRRTRSRRYRGRFLRNI